MNIKYRAWLKTEQKMYYLKGFVYRYDNTIDLYTKSGIVLENVFIGNVVLMQSVDIRDDQLCEIYEGDIIVKYNDFENMYIVDGYSIDGLNLYNMKDNTHTTLDNNKSIKIIGHEYESEID